MNRTLQIAITALTLASLTVGIGVTALLTGCNTEAVNQFLRITPDNATIRLGEEIVLTAEGGFEYTWSLESDKDHWATLSPRTGPRVTYRSIFDPASNDTEIVHIVTVSSVVRPSPTSNTSTSGVPEGARTAQSFITHISTQRTDI